MSMSLLKTKTYKVYDPIIDINRRDNNYIIQGANTVAYRRLPSTSYSNQSATFGFDLSPLQILDRLVYLQVPISIHFAGSGTPTGSPKLLQGGFDAPRFLALQNIIQSLVLQINNASITLENSEIIPHIMHYMNNEELRKFFSTSTSYCDQSQEYGDLSYTNRNPLSIYWDNFGDTIPGRGNVEVNAFTNLNSSADITFTVTEPLYLSPLLYTSQSEKGFMGVQTISFLVQWAPDLTYVWSHDTSGPYENAGGTINSLTVTIGQPVIYLKTMTAPLLERVPDSIIYNFSSFDKFTLNAGSWQPSQVKTIASNNIILKQIPEKMYFFIRRSNAIRSYVNTDTYLKILNVNITLNSNTGILSNASFEQLYEMSVRNGLNMSFAQFGAPNQFSIGDIDYNIGQIGSIIGTVPALDWGLVHDDITGGLGGSYNFQVNIQAMNINYANEITDTTLYIIAVNSGAFTIANMQAIQNLSIISKEDILDANRSPHLNFNDLMSNGLSYGGKLDLWSDIKRFGKEAWDWTRKEAIPFIKDDLLPIAKALLPIIIPLIAGARKSKAKSKDQGKGGCYECMDEDMMDRRYGGKIISRDELRSRVNRR